MISDDDLRNELKKYGDSNIPKITDRNREIYIKKLNHYKARQKLEENPSKQSKSLLKSHIKSEESMQQDLDVIIDEDSDNSTRKTRSSTRKSMNNNNNSNTSINEYVQVNNAYTSPMSNSILSYNNNSSMSNSISKPDVIHLDDTTPPKSQDSDLLTVRRLKDRIELERTLQKYRNDITDILETSKARARIVNTTKLENEIRVNEIMKVKDKKVSILNKINDNLKNFMNNSFVELSLKLSKLLPYFILVIFLLISMQYIRMKMNANNITISNVIMGKESYVQEMYCADIKDTKCTQTKVLVRELIDYLRSISGNVDCQLNKYTYNVDNAVFIDKCIHYNDIAKYFDKKGLVKNAQQNLKPAMDSVIEAILKHPHWRLKLYNSLYKETEIVNDVEYFMSDISLKSVTCRLREIIHTLSLNVLIVLLICFTLFLAFFILKVFHKHRQEKRKSFYELVSQVVSCVEKQYETSIQNTQIKPYVAISHIYDTIFDHSQRLSQKQVWQQVVKFIADHESRIRVETQLINGEETLVWRWIVPVNLINPSSTFTTSITNVTLKQSPAKIIATPQQQQLQPQIDDDQLAHQTTTTASSTTTSITNSTVSNGWQGNAFAKQEKLLVSPTACLKIRNMFDPAVINTDPNFMIKINNDILSRCANFANSILHISCDKKSREGCVYIKCNNTETAGKVYLMLNNTWYNGKLLNVKYLREDRYLERFPDSANCN